MTRAWLSVRPDSATGRVLVEVEEGGAVVSRLRLTGDKAVALAVRLLSCAHLIGHELPFAVEHEEAEAAPPRLQ